MTNEGRKPSLKLDLDSAQSKVLLRAAETHGSALVQFVGRFRSGSQLSPLEACIDLDDLLAEIGLISTWPDAQGVEWQTDLRDLVLGVLKDAEVVAERLHGEGDTGEIRADSVPGMLGADWKADLRKFQLRDVAKLLSLQHGANFSVPGAGKTRVSMAVYSAQKAQGVVRRLLVVCPKSAYEAWQYETGECFTQPLRLAFVDRRIDEYAEVLVVNYERLDRSLGLLRAWLKAAPAMLILDEAHRMKLGVRGTYGAACMALAPLAKRRLILTGTPAPNGAKDLESLLGFVWPGHGQRSVARAVAGGDLAHASTVLRPLFTRTTKHELGLPPMQPRIRYVEMPQTSLHGQIYAALASGRHGEDRRDDLSGLGKTALRLLMAATSPSLLVQGGSRYEPVTYQLPPLEAPEGSPLRELLERLSDYEVAPKYKETLKIVAENAQQGRKTLVWTTFVRSLTTLEQLLGKYGVAIVHGGTPDRDEQLRRFREDPDCAVLLSNPASLGEGISLHQDCHDAVYVDRDFMAGRYLQSLDRIHRLGLAPETETRVTVLAARHTIDEVVAVRLGKKLDFMHRVLDDPTLHELAYLEEEPEVAAGLTHSDVESLVRHLDSW
ncbi:DEAD/DEAH box helicase [Streptomyces sp. MAR4 CNY-716]